MSSRCSDIALARFWPQNRESKQKHEPIDKTGIRTLEKKKVWYRKRGEGSYEERVQDIGQDG
jgi:hypothetical protein